MLTKWMFRQGMACALAAALSSCQSTPPSNTNGMEDLRSASLSDMPQVQTDAASRPDSGADAGGGSGGDMSPAAPPVSYCVKGCTQASNCATDTGAFSTDNYSCQASACKYLGCVMGTECATTFGAGYVCP